jgi:hypothetical protein
MFKFDWSLRYEVEDNPFEVQHSIVRGGVGQLKRRLIKSGQVDL